MINFMGFRKSDKSNVDCILCFQRSGKSNVDFTICFKSRRSQMLLLQCVLKDWGSSKWILHCVSYENDQSGNIWGGTWSKEAKILENGIVSKAL